MKGELEWTRKEYDEIYQGVTACEISVDEIREDLDRFHKGTILKGLVKDLAEAVDNLRDAIETYW